MRHCGAAGMVAACLVLAAQTWGAQGKLTLVDAPAVAVDPACSTCVSSTVLQFRNDGPGKAELAPTASETAVAGKLSGAKVTLQTVTDPAGKSPAQTGTVEPGKIAYIRADVRNVVEFGEWDIEIRNQGAKIGTFKLIHTRVNFNVKLDVPNQDAPEMSLEKGVPKLLSFTNADDRAYPVTWELAVDGKKDFAQGGLTIPAGGAGQVAFSPPCGWFGLKSLLKDETADGRLTVRLRRMDCVGRGCESSPDAPAKTFKVKLNLAICSAGLQAFWVDLFILFALLVGAAASFAANLLFPNYIRRRDFRRLLNQIESRVAGLPVALSSRLRVLAGIERKSLEEGVGHLNFYSLEFKGRMSELELSAKQLSTRVDLLQRMGTDRIRFEALRVEASPPTLVDGIEDLFEELIEGLDSVGLSDAVLTSATAKVAEIEKRIGDLHKAGPDFAHELVQRATRLTKEFDQSPTVKNLIGKSQICGHMRKALPGLFDQLAAAPTDPNDLMPGDYAKWDMMLYKLELIRRYVDWREAGQRADRAEQFGAIEAELVKRLLLFSWEGVNSARRYVLEIEQNIFAEDLEAQIQERHVRIRKDRFAVRQFAPTQFHVEFDDPVYNTAEAQKDWTCIWHFDHGPFVDPPGEFKEGPKMMREYGWVASHYFPEARRYQVWVRIRRQRHRGEVHRDLPPRTIDVEGEKPGEGKRERRWVEVLQVFLAILPALVGLVAGAKEQVLKLDLIPAALAIFMIGFGSDQIKDKLTQ